MEGYFQAEPAGGGTGCCPSTLVEASNCKLCFSRYQIFDGVHLLDECDRNEATNSSMCEVLAFVFADDIFSQ